MKHHKLFLLFPLFLLGYSIWSYTQVAPNLILSSHPLYLFVQQQLMWRIGYHHRPLSTLFYVVVILGAFWGYWSLLQRIKKGFFTLQQVGALFGFCLLVLLPSYPGLSNDVFNYSMNSKMMHEYNASPYEYAAWDFPDEPWLAFMTNVHTTTPYGKVWTGIGYGVYAISGGYLQLTMLLFRLVATAAVGIIGWSIWYLADKNKLYAASLFLFNPLVLFEAVSNAHNDIVMMAFFMLGLVGLKFFSGKSLSELGWVALTIGWGLSVYTKLVTIISPVVYGGYLVIKKRFTQIGFVDLLALSMIAAQFGDSARRFFPWYMLWSVPFIGLVQVQLIKQLLFLFSITGMLSYGFFIFTGQYTSGSELARILVLFSLPFLWIVRWGINLLASPRKKMSERLDI